jgi:hypothetical protein
MEFFSVKPRCDVTVRKLFSLYRGSFLLRVSYKNVKLCCDYVDDERSEKLRSRLHQYLECDPPESTVSALSFVRESDAVAAKDSEIQVSAVCPVVLSRCTRIAPFSSIDKYSVFVSQIGLLCISG